MQHGTGTSLNFIDVLADILPANVPVALLDFPWHSNPGDSAIWKGETLALATLGHRVVYTATLHNFDRNRLERLLPEDGVVLLHGGGNFGDLWPLLHNHREWVVAALRNRRVVQLPQTVHFDDKTTGQESLAQLGTHPNLTVMARDQRSLELLVEAELDARLCTDPTTTLWPNTPHRHQSAGCSRVLYLLRSDDERRIQLPPELTTLALDWGDLGVGQEKVGLPSCIIDRSLDAIDRTLSVFGRALPASCSPRFARQQRHCDQLVAAATSVILAHDVIVTDRLHAMLIGLAYGRSVVAVDSGYGKLDSYIDTFLNEEPLLHHLSSFDQLSAVLEKIGSSQ